MTNISITLEDKTKFFFQEIDAYLLSKDNFRCYCISQNVKPNLKSYINYQKLKAL